MAETQFAIVLCVHYLGKESDLDQMTVGSVEDYSNAGEPPSIDLAVAQSSVAAPPEPDLKRGMALDWDPQNHGQT